MSDIKNSVNLLPEFLRSDKNSKFLASTIDQLIQTPQVERVDGFVGSKLTPTYNPLTDSYLTETSELRNRYTLEPALVLKDSTNNITDIIAYDDLINTLKNRGSVTDNLDELFRSKTYSFDPLIDWDKLVNFTDYCWLPTGPIAIQFPEDTSNGFAIENNIVGQPSYTMSNGYALSNGMKILFSANAELKYRNKEYIVEGVGNSIVLVEFNSLSFYGTISTVLNETYDTTTFDTYSFDADRPLPLTPEYITINKASNDANPWSQYNRWFHKDIIKISNEINNIPNIIPLESKAKRPIIEFRANLKLHNFGSTGIQNVDLIDITTTDALAQVHNSYGYYIDGVQLQQGHRIIFNSDDNYEVRGKVYKVIFDITGVTPILKLIPELVYPAELNSLNVKLGSKFSGTSWYFDDITTKWIYAQQHTTINQPPLFDLFTSDGISYTKVNNPNNFIGNQIFGYEIGTGNNDSVLGFPLKYQNNGKSYLFKNYFMTDVISITQNNIASTIPTGNTFLKLNDTLVNVWTEAIEHKIPIIEIQTIVASTTTLILTCLDAPISTNISIFAYINNVKIPITVTNVSNAVIITNSSTFAANEVVLLKIYTDQLPNSNGYYEAPIGLSHNPLNEFLNSLTLGELKDHLTTMINNTSSVITNNLRDISDYTKYGSRLIINDTPLVFAQLFLGKKEHNVVNAIRQAGTDYDRFKLNFLRVIKEINSTLSAPDALDLALTIINDEKDIRSLYRTSDMLGYGKNKIVRTITITDVTITSYPISFNFDINRLSFQSVIIYRNGIQLIGTRNEYYFDYDNNAVIIVLPLTLKDVISIHCYLDTNGSYIPPTPSKLGMYPATVPTVYVDTSVTPSRTYILGHDNSSIYAYGDYRDAIILEYEKRVYNNIKVRFNNKIYDSIAAQPGAFNNLNYTIDNFNNLLEGDFSTWCGTYGIDSVTNDTFDASRSTTWNYGGTVDTFFKKPIPISIAFPYFYGAQRPNQIPWRMLGYFDRPIWWTRYYGFAPYRSTNTLLWTDLQNGYSRGTNSYNPKYARPGLLSIIPVDANGNLITNIFLLGLAIDNTYTNKEGNWKFGDGGPVERAYRERTSSYAFSICAALAILNPVQFCATQYDLSRTTLNAAGQVIYNGNYLNLKNLVIAGENDNQIAGYGVYIAENGRRVDSQYDEKLRQDLNYLNINLFHKLGGFASKDKLQITIDSIDPKSTSPGVILPSEDYSLILNVSNPIVTARISGIIVQRSKGKFKIKGYDVKNPYFEILKPIKISTSGAVRVGGVSEEFTEWSSVVNNSNNGLSSVDLTSASSSTTRYYKQGQVVRYNNRFYRVKTGHNAETSFDLTLYQQLSELPIKGGASAQISKTFENTVTKIPYGTEFSSVQEIYDVIIGYGAFLEKQGFIFDDFNSDLNEILNWKLTGKEFLYWTTQNFADGNLITLSPFANSLKYNFPNSVVDDISGKKYEYSLLKADGKPYPIDRFTMSREDTVCTIKTRDANEGLFFAVLHSVQKEHAMVFNNYTVFNDTIYDITTGYKQQRIKLSGFRTKNWNGDLFSPGFVFDDVNITDWQSYKMYLPGSIVRYNGKYYQSLIKIISSKTFDFTKWTQLPEKPVSKLLPNFDYKVDQFEDFYSLDIDNFDSGQQQLAQHLTGYTPRSYLNNIFTNPISQYKFYQGLIKDKGTKNAVDKLSKAGQFSNKGELSFNEEWAFRIGHYGSFETFNEIEFTLTEGTSLENPYVVKFVDTIPADANPLINHIVPSDLLLTPNDYSASNAILSMAGTSTDNIVLTTAGYVRLDDVTTTAYSKNSLLDIANNAMIQDGVTVWLGFLENGDWAVYRYTKQLSKITGVFVSAPTIEITFVTDGHHNLNIGDIISVVRFNEQVNGVYIVSAIPAINQFAVKSTLASIENAVLINYGGLYRFENVRYSNLKQLSEITDLLKLNAGDKVWIDSGTDNKWQVYEKIKNYDVKVIETSGQPLDQEFGSSVWASDNSSVMLVSSPNWHTDNAYSYGRVKVYNQIKTEWKRQYDYILNANNKTYADPTSVSDFGHAIQYDIGKKLYITGAPLASSIRSHSTGTGTVILSTGSGLIKSWSNEGLVKIISRDEDHGKIDVNVVLVNPYGQLTTTATNSKFGYSIAINQVVATTATTLLVGAPGSSTGYVFAYKLNLTTATNATATITGFSHSTNVLSVRPPITLTLSTGSYWGHKIAGSVRGFAISAPGYNTSTGVVQIYNNDLQSRQTITSPFGLNGRFGHDIAISNDAMYMVISAPYARGTNEPYGKVAVYKNLGNLTNYLASRPEVILALATNVSAPVYYGEVTILNWMTAGLTGFNQYWIDYRASHPADAAIYDAERAVDAVIKDGSNAGNPIVDSRARVIAAYQNHPDAQIYPDEASIRYWMENGLGTLFNVLTSRQLANGLGGARRSTDPDYKLNAVTLNYAWNDFMNNYGVWNSDGSPVLNFTTSVSFNRSGIYIFELAVDNYADLHLDETIILSSYGFTSVERREVYVPQGTHTLRIAAYNSGGPGGIAFKITSDIAFTNTDTSIFDASVVYNNILYPNDYARIVAERLALQATFQLDQIITNPLLASDLKFGYSVSISNNNNTIGIGALGKNRTKVQLFDETSNIGETTFDNSSTKFYDSILDGGTVYLYNKVGDKFIQADELNDVNIISGSKYGSCLAVTNNNVFVGAPASDLVSNLDKSKFYIFNKIDTTSQSWKLLRTQEDTVDVSGINRISLIDTLKEEVIEYLDVIDPLKGKIAGIADQELTYKAASDPATYSIGLAGTIVDSATSWIDNHIGELWWDLSTVKYQWYEQGDDIFRKNNWGKLFPGASIDIYEWVKSDILPSEWAAQADTNKGLIKGISGQPKYVNNSSISIKQLFNNVTGSFENVYYFWVKNKVTLPGTKNRRLSGYQVASYIADPVSNGLKFIEILSPSAIAFANVQPLLIGNRINANISTDNRSSIPRHTEWLLLNENNANSVPNTLLEKKLFDSLIGHDSLGNSVPDMALTDRNRYGISIRPRQTLFKNRIEALRNLVSFVNSVFLKNRIIGIYEFTNLNKKEEIPAESSNEYDVLVEDIEILAEIETIKYQRAEINCYADNGKIKSVSIIDAGFGYINPPKINILTNSSISAEFVTEIDSYGRLSSVTIINAGNGYPDGVVRSNVRPHTVIVEINSESGNRWTQHEFDYIKQVWVKTHTQEYNTTLFWEKIDWKADTFNNFKIINHTITDLFALASITEVEIGDYLKVKNSGDGSYIILEKVQDSGNFTPSYNIIYKEKGTIRLRDTLWNYNLGKYAYDKSDIDETLYDELPDLEIYYILVALRDDIFINDLKINWNLFFFTAVKYALTEQKLLDWAFKTSFINVTNNVGSLNQQPVYQLNNESYFEDYINEIKPYRTKIRSYSSIYKNLEQANLSTTDFDFPSVYNEKTNNFDIVPVSTATTGLIATTPWKDWNNNYKLHVGSIKVGYAGSGYTQRPIVSIVAATGDTGSGASAEAYIRNGSLYEVLVTNPGSGYKTAPIVQILNGGPSTVPDTYRNVYTTSTMTGTEFNAYNSSWEIGPGTISWYTPLNIPYAIGPGTISWYTLGGLPYHSYGNSASGLGEQSRFAISPYRGGNLLPDGNSNGTVSAITGSTIGRWLNGVNMYGPALDFYIIYYDNPDSPPEKVRADPPTGYINYDILDYNVLYSAAPQLNYNFYRERDNAGGFPSLYSDTYDILNDFRYLSIYYNYRSYSFAQSWLTGSGHVSGSRGTTGTADASVIPYLAGTLTHYNGHSKILGISLDGYPVYGPYGYSSATNASSTVRIMRSGYTVYTSPNQVSARVSVNVLNTTTHPMGMFIQDHYFVGNGDLDTNNGRFCVTPDYPNGTYAYFCTISTSTLTPVYPYVIGNTFYSTPADTSYPAEYGQVTPGSGGGIRPKITKTSTMVIPAPSGPVTDVARVSVIMSNNVTRANTIGMKFDRVSLTGNLTQLNTSDEFVCDGTTNKFILSWLPSPDKTTIVPLLDGKLIFATDYTIEYYEVTTENTSNDVAKLFPINSWKGESSIDHRYRYYTSVVTSSLAPSEIQHYARFVFLNQIPSFGQVFKISYNKNIKLYNAIDRISAAYNPTNSMPGKELPLLMSGAEFSGLSVQGLRFNQSSNWDSLDTPYDSISWYDTISHYQIVDKIYSPLAKGYGGATVPAVGEGYALVKGMQVSVVGSKPNEYFRKNTTVSEVSDKGISFDSGVPPFYPIKVFSSGTSIGSTLTIVVSGLIGTTLEVGDIIVLGGVRSLYGNGISGIRINTAFTTTGVVTITLPAPFFSTSLGATTSSWTAVKVDNTVTGFTSVIPGMGYSYLQLHPAVNTALAYPEPLRIAPNTGLYSPARIMYSGTYAQTTGGGIIISSTAPIFWGTSTNIAQPFGVGFLPDIEAFLDTSFSTGVEIAKIVNDNTIIGKLQTPVSSVYSAFNNEPYFNPDGTRSSIPYPKSGTAEAPNASQYGDPVIRLLSIVKEIPLNGRLLEYVNTVTVASTSSIAIQTGVYYDSAKEATILLSNTSTTIVTTDAPGGDNKSYTSGFLGTVNYSTYPLPPFNNPIVYKITPSTDGKNRAVVTVYTLDPSIKMISGNLQVSIYGATQLEFWKTDPGRNGLLDSLINENYVESIGTLQQSAIVGYRPEDIIIDGNNFLNAIDSYAPEECVPGHVRDALGINVYTAEPPSSPFIMTGVIGIPAKSILPIRTRINLLSENAAGFLVYADGIKFDRVAAQNFTTNTQFSIQGDEIIIPSQPRNTRVGYTYITVGSDVGMDSNFVSTSLDVVGTGGGNWDVVVESLLSINDVRSVYVLINGNEIGPVPPSGSSYGYVLQAMSSTNNRASVSIQGLLPGYLYDVQAWFFTKSFANFNRVHEQIFTISTLTSQLLLDSTIGIVQPVSDKVIVEVLTTSTRTRLLPPWVTYYRISNGQTTFAIDPLNNRPSVYSLDNVKVFLNGEELRPGYDYSVNGGAQTFTLILPTISAGDAIAVMPLVNYEYIISGNKLTLSSAVSTGTVKITSFTDHDNMLIRTERFTLSNARSFTLNSPIFNDSYIWITANNQWLISGYDYKVLDNARTVVFAESIEIGNNANVIVTVINPPIVGTTILGYRMFSDMFNRQYISRLSTYFSTRLLQPLQYTDTQIIVEDGDHLFQPNPTLRLPGIILVDGERIEYTSKDGNVLSGLRRGTLGTGPAKFSDQYTTVIDQSITQKINTEENINVQYIASSNTNTYVISTLTNTLTNYSVNSSGDVTGISLPSSVANFSNGITLLTTSTTVNPPAATDQVEVYYGGRKLRKTSLAVHDISVSYYNTPDSITTLPPEFSITTATQTLILNINETITTGTKITVVQRTGKVWEENTSTSILSTATSAYIKRGNRAEFLRQRPAQLPDIYFYGGDKILYTNGIPLTNEDGENLEGY